MGVSRRSDGHRRTFRCRDLHVLCPGLTKRLPCLVFACWTTACGTPDCIEVDTDCAPLYEPTWDQVFENTLVPTCSTGGTSCHAPEGAQGDLILTDRDEAYEQLLDRVTPGDPSCGTLITKLESTNPDVMMPPGQALIEAERCAVRLWIADGALP